MAARISLILRNFDEFGALKSSAKDRLFQGITREIAICAQNRGQYQLEREELGP